MTVWRARERGLGARERGWGARGSAVRARTGLALFAYTRSPLLRIGFARLTYEISPLARVAAVAVAALSLACSPTPAGEPVVRGADELRQASTQVTANGVDLSLSVEAWRSFQPIRGNEGDPMIAILRVHAAASEGVPGALALATVYLLHAGEVVEVDAREEEPRASNANTAEFVLRDGPRWAAGDSIDVIAELSGLGGANVLLRAPRVAIARVD